MDRYGDLCHAFGMTAPALKIPAWSLADRLRKIRRECTHLDQEGFAEMLGVKPSRYGAWETGRNKPENIVWLAERIEDATGVPAAWVLGVWRPDGGEGVRHQGLEPRTRWLRTLAGVAVAHTFDGNFVANMPLLADVA